MADITDFQLGQGETFRINAQIYNQSAKRNVDISDFTFVGQVRENYTTDEIAAEFNIEVVPPAESGSIFIELTSEQTAQLEQRSYVYDVEMKNLNVSPPTVRRILEGSLTIRPNVTR
jgi:hypothetical protein